MKKLTDNFDMEVVIIALFIIVGIAAIPHMCNSKADIPLNFESVDDVIFDTDHYVVEYWDGDQSYLVDIPNRYEKEFLQNFQNFERNKIDCDKWGILERYNGLDTIYMVCKLS